MNKKQSLVKQVVKIINNDIKILPDNEEFINQIAEKVKLPKKKRVETMPIVTVEQVFNGIIEEINDQMRCAEENKMFAMTEAYKIKMEGEIRGLKTGKKLLEDFKYTLLI